VLAGLHELIQETQSQCHYQPGTHISAYETSGTSSAQNKSLESNLKLGEFWVRILFYGEMGKAIRD
tara:strand:- start:4843 stop:5040 length:198 start_codon:yes stop_codon:yes gene_type:complete